MLDVSVSYNRYKFLGHEFLTWLWYIIENDPEFIKGLDPEVQALEIGNRIVLENRHHDTLESITIQGDDAGLEEGILSLRKGGIVTEINLVFKVGDSRWRFNIKGESLSFSNFKTPEIAPIEKPEDVESVVIEKAFLCEKVISFIEKLYERFIKVRISNKWERSVRPAIKQWVTA